MPRSSATLAELSEQLEAHARVQGLILLLLAGYAFPRTVIEEVALACGVTPVDVDIPAHGGH